MTSVKHQLKTVNTVIVTIIRSEGHPLLTNTFSFEH